MFISTDIYSQDVYHENLRNRCLVCPSYISSNKPRLNVITTSKEKLIEEVKKISSIFNRGVILQDLVLIGGLGKTIEERSFIVLAAELFIRMPKSDREDFLFYLRDSRSHHLDLFNTALVSNAEYHELMKSEKKENWGLTDAELNLERCYAAVIKKDGSFIKNNF